MTAYIGLRSGPNLLMLRNEPMSSLKQQALFFDQIDISQLNACIKHGNSFPSGMLEEIQWLLDNKIIFNVELDLEFIPHNQLTTQLVQLVLASSRYHSNLFKSRVSDVQQLAVILNGMKIAQQTSEIIMLRLLSIQVGMLTNNEAIPLISHTDFPSELPGTQVTEAVQVVIKALPVPNQNTPWEKILDYKNDPDTKKDFLEFRRWVRKIGKQGWSAEETEEELLSLINRFQEHMRVHKMKANTELIETIIKVPLEIVSLKFSKVLDPIFAVKKHRIALLEAEINAPGREIAYLIKTKEMIENQI